MLHITKPIPTPSKSFGQIWSLHITKFSEHDNVKQWFPTYFGPMLNLDISKIPMPLSVNCIIIFGIVSLRVHVLPMPHQNTVMPHRWGHAPHVGNNWSKNNVFSSSWSAIFYLLLNEFFQPLLLYALQNKFVFHPVISSFVFLNFSSFHMESIFSFL